MKNMNSPCGSLDAGSHTWPPSPKEPCAIDTPPKGHDDSRTDTHPHASAPPRGQRKSLRRGQALIEPCALIAPEGTTRDAHVIAPHRSRENQRRRVRPRRPRRDDKGRTRRRALRNPLRPHRPRRDDEGRTRRRAPAPPPSPLETRAPLSPPKGRRGTHTRRRRNVDGAPPPRLTTKRAPS